MPGKQHRPCQAAVSLITPGSTCKLSYLGRAAGGKREPEDDSAHSTACREMWEESGGGLS